MNPIENLMTFFTLLLRDTYSKKKKKEARLIMALVFPLTFDQLLKHLLKNLEKNFVSPNDLLLNLQIRGNTLFITAWPTLKHESYGGQLSSNEMRSDQAVHLHCRIIFQESHSSLQIICHDLFTKHICSADYL